MEYVGDELCYVDCYCVIGFIWVWRKVDFVICMGYLIEWSGFDVVVVKD